MKLTKHVACLALVGAGLAVTPGLAGSAGAAPDNRSVQDKMRAAADGAVVASKEASTGKLGFVRAQRGGDLLASQPGASTSAAAAKADAYLQQFGGAFGAQWSQLDRAGTQASERGWTITYTQSVGGVPVFGSELRANLDKQGDLTSVNGFADPTAASVSTKPVHSAAEAADRAIQAVKADPTGHDDQSKVDTSGLKVASNTLMIYREGSVRGAGGKSLLTHVVEVSNDANIRDMVFVDAASNKIVNRYSMVDDALHRRLYEQTYSPASKVWEEGDPFPGTLNIWQQNEVTYTGDAYWFFKNTWGRDSYDGAGAAMETVNNDPRISCPNANWNGVTTNYCDGTAVDDVIAHEWGHAYTEYTHGLIYQWQPGALNESYSDVWGETVDLINGKDDADEGNITAKRPDNSCSTHSPAKPVVTINSPASIAKTCDAGMAQFGPSLDGTGVTGDVALGTTAAGETTACEPITSNVTGKVALVDRGTCAFTIKVKNAQDAGAKAVLVADNVEASPSGMSGNDPSITIPSVRIRLSDGDRIKSALPTSTVNVTMKDAGGDRVDSYRWLMGEDATAFGGAIRDMWTPTCHNDPGKVSDAEYYCATDDGGGVHSNSGVPNHAYALLVDGGTYNGVTVAGIGLDKAANVYFRAMTAYQTPTTDFADHADALDAACADLTGTTVNKLTVAENATPGTVTVTAADCAAVDAASRATELRKEPVQCNFQPMLNKDTPAACGEGYKSTVVWSENFEDGLAGWKASSEVVHDGASGMPWEADSSAPGGRAGTVAYGPAPDRGQCDGSTADFSSRDSITSPLIALPASSLKAPQLRFDHYVATEANYDGGNVKMSVDGGEFVVIPASAYAFNAPGTLASEAEGNTNPLAGEDGFSGTDGGKVTGSWGTSVVDLAKAGVKPGQDVRFRFDIGRDGCGGIDGWYVDNVRVIVCKYKVKVKAVHRPQPSKYGKKSRVVVTVGRDGTKGAAPTGTVLIKWPKGGVMDKDRLAAGTATLQIPAKFRRGSTKLPVVFVANDRFARAQTFVWVKVVR